MTSLSLLAGRIVEVVELTFEVVWQNSKEGNHVFTCILLREKKHRVGLIQINC